MAFAPAFLVVLLVAPSAFAAQYPVDWKLGADYSSWTTKDLNAGDTLVFTYDGTHNVEQVTKSAYDNCATSNAIKTYNGGKTTITLAEGPSYFICGTPGHCDAGMKLQVTAKAAGSGSPSTPSSTPTPSGSGSTSSPAGGNGATGLSSVTPLMFGLPLALGTLFAFMCSPNSFCFYIKRIHEWLIVAGTCLKVTHFPEKTSETQPDKTDK